MASNQELKSLWLGPSGTLGSAGESELFYPGELGKTQWHADPSGSSSPVKLQKVLRAAADTFTIVDNGVAYWSDREEYEVTGNLADAIGSVTDPYFAGVFLGTGPTAGNFGIIQIAGPVHLDLDTGTNAAGDVLVNGATDFTTSGIVAVVATDAEQQTRVFATATAAGSSTDGSAAVLANHLDNS
jgi:hypothetical protein